MEAKKLFKLLTLINGVEIRKWETVRMIVGLIQSKEIKVLKKEWAHDQYQSDELLDLSNINVWSTFDDTCIELFFHNAATPKKPKNKLICDVKIYNGNPFDGWRVNLRFTASLLIPDKFIGEIEKYIGRKFEKYLETAYENHLEAQKRTWIHNTKIEILNK